MVCMCYQVSLGNAFSHGIVYATCMLYECEKTCVVCVYVCVCEFVIQNV